MGNRPVGVERVSLDAIGPWRDRYRHEMNCQVIQQFSTDHIVKMQYTRKRQTDQSSPFYICWLPPKIGAS